MISIVALTVLFSVQSGASADYDLYYGTPSVSETMEPTANPPAYDIKTTTTSVSVEPTFASTNPPAYIMPTTTTSVSVKPTLVSTYTQAYDAKTIDGYSKVDADPTSVRYGNNLYSNVASNMVFGIFSFALVVVNI